MRAILRLSFFIQLLGLAVYSNAQINIQLLDENFTPVSGVVVESPSLSLALISNLAGSVQTDETAMSNIVISHIGYQSIMLERLDAGNYTFIMKSSTTQLDEVVVRGFNNDVELVRVSGSIRKLESQELNRFNQLSLVRPVNLIPGVTFEERAASSYRVSIRGSSLRSPFGVRNVKIYWNGIPFTDPGGNTFINLLDRQNMSQLEIIKGPAGSVYGAGTGGVMQLNSTSYADIANSLQFQATVGSFNLQRYALSWNTLSEKGSFTAKFSRHTTDGYRQHNESERNVLELDGLLFSGEQRTIELSMIYSDLNYQIPGGLTAEQVEEDPTQPRPRSVEQSSSIDHQMMLMKFGQLYEFNERFSNSTQLFGTFRRFENPFILDYKRDSEQRLGFRTFNKHRLGSSEQMTLNYGLEYQQSFFDGKNFGNRGGESDTIRFADELNNTELIAFASLKYNWNKWNAELGLSYGQTQYDINRTVDKINNNPRAYEKTFDPVLNPRVALSRNFSPWLNAHFSISSGYSVPTTSEVRTNEGSLNTDLEAERGVNYEVNLRGGSGRFSYDLALFHFDLSQSITTYTNEDGVVLFRNSGNIIQNGLELELKEYWLQNASGFLKNVSSSLSYTHHNFEFGDYENRGTDLSGNQLTGTAPNVLGITTDLASKSGLFLNISYLYTDKIPLNDQNTVYADSFQLLDMKLGYTMNIGNTMAQLAVGVDNVLNEAYSLGNDLNAFGRRYFQPAPTRNFFIDLKLKFQ